MKYIIGFEENKIIYFAGEHIANSLEIKICDSVSLPNALEDKEQWETAFLELAQRNNLRGKQVTVALPSKGILYREIYLPNVKNKKQLDASILNEMLYYHSNIADYTVDYLETGRVDSEGRQGYLTYAVHNSKIEECQDLLNKVGLRAKTIEVMPECAAKTVQLCYPEEKNLILLGINEDYLELYIIENGLCVLLRRIGVKYASFEGNNDILSEELADQINKILRFQSTRPYSDDISKIIIFGDVVDTEKIVPLLQASLELIRPLQLICSQFNYNGKVTFGADLPCGDTQCQKAVGAFITRK